jgi:hypothetical protein
MFARFLACFHCFSWFVYKINNQTPCCVTWKWTFRTLYLVTFGRFVQNRAFSPILAKLFHCYRFSNSTKKIRPIQSNSLCIFKQRNMVLRHKWTFYSTLNVPYQLIILNRKWPIDSSAILKQKVDHKNIS